MYLTKERKKKKSSGSNFRKVSMLVSVPLSNVLFLHHSPHDGGNMCPTAGGNVKEMIKEIKKV